MKSKQLPDPVAPINQDLVFEITMESGGPAYAGIDIEASTGRVTIAPGALPPGTHRLAISALNFAGWSSPRIVELGVQPPAEPPAGRGAEWMAAHNLEGCIDSGPSSDSDGFCLVTEYLFGLSPTEADASASSLRTRGDHFDIEWLALKDGAIYTLEQSTNLRDWTAVVGAGVPEDLGEAGPFHRRQRVSVPRSGDVKFYRVAAEFVEPSNP